MKLYEFEGKKLLQEEGIIIPIGRIVDDGGSVRLGEFKASEVIIKAQMLRGKRGKSGFIATPENWEDATTVINRWLKEKEVAAVLIEEKLKKSDEYFVSCFYNTRLRRPEMVFSAYGGMDIEELARKFPKAVVRRPVDPIRGLESWQAREMAQEAGLEGVDIIRAGAILVKLYQTHQKYDCRVVEINPLIRTQDGELIAADAKIELDDSALFRLPRAVVPERSRESENPRERAAKEIDALDYRGSAGSTYIDLDGDIGVLASGGGASMMAMDSLIAAGGKPANFTEYSGNPPRAKVKRLTEIVLSKPGLRGLWIVGATANFTDIYETLMGVVEGLRTSSAAKKIPIVIRRAGPRDKEAFEELERIKKEEGFNFHLFGNETSISESAEYLVKRLKSKK